MTDKWYTHMPMPVYEQENITVLWNHIVHTDREVTTNSPDKIIKNKQEKTYLLIDVAIPADRHIVQKNGKEAKLQEFMYSDKHMLNLKCKVIPVIIGATGIVTKGLRKNLEAILGKHSIDSL
jgi:hypothetical protein